MELRVCSSDEDIRALAALATEIWHEYFTAIISKEQIDYMVEKFQSYPALKKAIEEEHYTYFLAYEEGAMIGFCGVKPEKEDVYKRQIMSCEPGIYVPGLGGVRIEDDVLIENGRGVPLNATTKELIILEGNEYEV